MFHRPDSYQKHLFARACWDSGIISLDANQRLAFHFELLPAFPWVLSIAINCLRDVSNPDPDDFPSQVADIRVIMNGSDNLQNAAAIMAHQMQKAMFDPSWIRITGTNGLARTIFFGDEKPAYDLPAACAKHMPQIKREPRVIIIAESYEDLPGIKAAARIAQEQGLGVQKIAVIIDRELDQPWIRNSGIPHAAVFTLKELEEFFSPKKLVREALEAPAAV